MSCVAAVAQVEHVSTAICRKAIWLVLHKKTHVWCMDELDEDTGAKTYVYYVLVTDNELGEKKITPELITKYESTLAGVRPKGMKSREKILNICSCMHKLRYVVGDDPWKVRHASRYTRNARNDTHCEIHHDISEDVTRSRCQVRYAARYVRDTSVQYTLRYM